MLTSISTRPTTPLSAVIGAVRTITGAGRISPRSATHLVTREDALTGRSSGVVRRQIGHLGDPDVAAPGFAVGACEIRQAFGVGTDLEGQKFGFDPVSAQPIAERKPRRDEQRGDDADDADQAAD